MPNVAKQVQNNLARVRERIAEAAARSGRAADSVALVAVTKFVGDEAIRALAAAGCRVLGESRPQHLREKAERLADLGIQWHMIGHLQRNKVRRTLPLVGMLQSADSAMLIEAVEHHASDLLLRVPILLEVNVSGDADKHGFAPEAVESSLERLGNLRNIEVRGLMCMASVNGGLDVARRNFAALRKLRDCLRSKCPESVRLDELSMGMSGDYEVAIDEGATIVRIGSALFEGIEA